VQNFKDRKVKGKGKGKGRVLI